MMPETMRPNEKILKKSLIDLATENWKTTQVFLKLLSQADIQDQARYAGKLNWFIKKTEDNLKAAGLRVVNLEGEKYDTGMAVTAINLEEYEDESNLVVEKMLEPVIMGSNGVERTGTVILKEGKLE